MSTTSFWGHFEETAKQPSHDAGPKTVREEPEQRNACVSLGPKTGVPGRESEQGVGNIFYRAIPTEPY